MYINIGHEKALLQKDILAILDLENTANSAATLEFFRRMEKEKRVLDITKDFPRAMVITDTTMYVTSVSAGTLQRRFNDRNKTFEIDKE